MSGINKVILVGHIGKDPDYRILNDDVQVLTFPLATTEMMNKNGKTEQTEWHTILMWRALASAAHYVLKKGKLIYVEGKCHTRTYEDKEGVKRYVTEIVADNFKLLGRTSDFREENYDAVDVLRNK
jgi:single-strand DNA-binding protein